MNDYFDQQRYSAPQQFPSAHFGMPQGYQSETAMPLGMDFRTGSMGYPGNSQFSTETGMNFGHPLMNILAPMAYEMVMGRPMTKFPMGYSAPDFDQIRGSARNDYMKGIAEQVLLPSNSLNGALPGTMGSNPFIQPMLGDFEYGGSRTDAARFMYGRMGSITGGSLRDQAGAAAMNVQRISDAFSVDGQYSYASSYGFSRMESAANVDMMARFGVGGIARQVREGDIGDAAKKSNRFVRAGKQVFGENASAEQIAQVTDAISGGMSGMSLDKSTELLNQIQSTSRALDVDAKAFAEYMAMRKKMVDQMGPGKALDVRTIMSSAMGAKQAAEEAAAAGSKGPLSDKNKAIDAALQLNEQYQASQFGRETTAFFSIADQHKKEERVGMVDKETGMTFEDVIQGSKNALLEGNMEEAERLRGIATKNNWVSEQQLLNKSYSLTEADIQRSRNLYRPEDAIIDANQNLKRNEFQESVINDISKDSDFADVDIDKVRFEMERMTADELINADSYRALGIGLTGSQAVKLAGASSDRLGSDAVKHLAITNTGNYVKFKRKGEGGLEELKDKRFEQNLGDTFEQNVMSELLGGAARSLDISDFGAVAQTAIGEVKEKQAEYDKEGKGRKAGAAEYAEAFKNATGKQLSSDEYTVIQEALVSGDLDAGKREFLDASKKARDAGGTSAEIAAAGEEVKKRYTEKYGAEAKRRKDGQKPEAFWEDDEQKARAGKAYDDAIAARKSPAEAQKAYVDTSYAILSGNKAYSEAIKNGKSKEDATKIRKKAEKDALERGGTDAVAKVEPKSEEKSSRASSEQIEVKDSSEALKFYSETLAKLADQIKILENIQNKELTVVIPTQAASK